MNDGERDALVMQAGAVITCEGRTLSVKNTCLLFFQRPGVSVVGGFRQWIRNGRVVRKGEHGASIWIPLGAKADDGTADGASGEPAELRFGTATVFDVTQTQEIDPAVAAADNLSCAQLADAGRETLALES